MLVNTSMFEANEAVVHGFGVSVFCRRFSDEGHLFIKKGPTLMSFMLISCPSVTVDDSLEKHIFDV